MKTPKVKINGEPEVKIGDKIELPMIQFGSDTGEDIDWRSIPDEESDADELGEDDVIPASELTKAILGFDPNEVDWDAEDDDDDDDSEDDKEE